MRGVGEGQGVRGLGARYRALFCKGGVPSAAQRQDVGAQHVVALAETPPLRGCALWPQGQFPWEKGRGRGAPPNLPMYQSTDFFAYILPASQADGATGSLNLQSTIQNRIVPHLFRGSIPPGTLHPQWGQLTCPLFHRTIIRMAWNPAQFAGFFRPDHDPPIAGCSLSDIRPLFV
jgi:hypothetical protein